MAAKCEFACRPRPKVSTFCLLVSPFGGLINEHFIGALIAHRHIGGAIAIMEQ